MRFLAPVAVLVVVVIAFSWGVYCGYDMRIQDEKVLVANLIDNLRDEWGVFDLISVPDQTRRAIDQSVVFLRQERMISE